MIALERHRNGAQKYAQHQAKFLFSLFEFDPPNDFSHEALFHFYL
jgi:hypothetical protein